MPRRCDLLPWLVVLAACSTSSAFCPQAFAPRLQSRALHVCFGPRKPVRMLHTSDLKMVEKEVRNHENWDIDLTKYPPLFLAGGLCAMITHGVTVPIDLVKTSQQVHPGIYQSLAQGLSSIYAEHGFFGLFLGFAPTAVGFLLQGSLKYGFYEFFKDILAKFARKEGQGGEASCSANDGIGGSC